MKKFQSLSALVALSAFGCGAMDECPAFDYQPAPIELVLEDEGGELVCVPLEGRRKEPGIKIVNAELPGNLAPVEREEAYNETLGVLYNFEECTYVLVGWFDVELGKSLSIAVTEVDGYEPVTFSPKVTMDSCGVAHADTATVTLKRQ